MGGGRTICLLLMTRCTRTDPAALTTLNHPNSAGSAGCRAIGRTRLEHLQLRDNDRLDRAPAKAFRTKGIGQQVAIANLLDRVIHFDQRAADRRQLEPTIAPTKTLRKST